MNNLEQLFKNVDHNMVMYNLPAPTAETLERLQDTTKRFTGVSWLVAKHKIKSVEEFVQLVRRAMNIKSSGHPTQFERDLLANLDLNFLQQVANGGIDYTNKIINEMQATMNLHQSADASPFVKLIIEDVVNKKDTAFEMAQKRGPELCNEIRRIQKEVELYLDSQGKKYLIIDTETNSLPNKRKKGSGLPLQIAYLLIDSNLNIIDKDSFYIKQKNIDDGASKIHGITSKKLKTLDPIEPTEAYERIKPFVTDTNLVFVAHNSSFDLGVIERLKIQVDEINKVQDKVEYKNPQAICTLSTAKKLLPKYAPRSKKLESLLEHYEYTQEYIQTRVYDIFGSVCNAHDARYDIVATMYIAKHLGILK